MITIFTKKNLRKSSENKHLTEIKFYDFSTPSIDILGSSCIILYTDYIAVKILKNRYDGNYNIFPYENLCDFLEKYKKEI